MDFQLNIQPGQPDLEITVLNSRNQVIGGTVDDELILQLSRGLYIVRTKRDGAIEDEPVLLIEDKSIVAKGPPVYSAALIEGVANAYDYYSKPAQQISQPDYARDPGGAAGEHSGIFFFVRTPDRSQHRPGMNLVENFSLWDAFGYQMAKFDRMPAEKNDTDGWWAINLRLVPGIYYVRHEGKTNRDQVLQVFPHWQTQVFLMHRKVPLFSSARIFLGRWIDGFDPANESLMLVDRAFDLLQNRIPGLPGNQEDMSELRFGKSEFPMYGILAANLLLRRPDPNPKLILTVLKNLERIIPESVDLIALQWIAMHKFGTGTPEQQITHPPMIRACLEELVPVFDEHREAFADPEMFGNFFVNSYKDATWSSWNPFASEHPYGWVHSAVIDAIQTNASAPGAATLADYSTSLGLPKSVLVEAAQEIDTLQSTSSLPPEVGQKLNHIDLQLKDRDSISNRFEKTFSMESAQKKTGAVAVFPSEDLVKPGKAWKPQELRSEITKMRKSIGDLDLEKRSAKESGMEPRLEKVQIALQKAERELNAPSPDQAKVAESLKQAHSEVKSTETMGGLKIKGMKTVDFQLESMTGAKLMKPSGKMQK